MLEFNDNYDEKVIRSKTYKLGQKLNKSNQEKMFHKMIDGRTVKKN